MEQTQRSGKDVLLLVLTAVFWGAAFPLTRFTVLALPPLTAATLRYGLAGIFFALAMLRTGELGRGVTGRALLLWAAVGLAGIFAYNALFFVGMRMASASEGAVIIPLLNPVVVAVMAALFLRERLGGRLLAGCGISTAGIVLFILAGKGGQAAFHLAGDLLLVGACLAWGAYSVLAKTAMRASSPLQVTGWSNILGTLPFLLVVWGEDPVRAAAGAPAGVWGAILLMAFFCTFLAFTWWNRGVMRLGAARAGIFIYLVPVTGVLVSWLWLGEGLVAGQWVGAAVVVAGVALAGTSRRR